MWKCYFILLRKLQQHMPHDVLHVLHHSEKNCFPKVSDIINTGLVYIQTWHGATWTILANYPVFVHHIYTKTLSISNMVTRRCKITCSLKTKDHESWYLQCIYNLSRLLLHQNHVLFKMTCLCHFEHWNYNGEVYLWVNGSKSNLKKI